MGTPFDAMAARAVTEWLCDELATVSPDQIETPNACGVWSVAEVAAHLAWVALRYRNSVERALTGDFGPPGGVLAPGAGRLTPAQMAEQASAYRRELADGVLDAYLREGLVLVRLFESLAPDDWDRPAYHGAGVRTVRHLLGRHVLEGSVHGWDVVHCLGRAVHLPDVCHDWLVDAVPLYLGRFVPREPLASPERYRFILGPTVPHDVSLVVHGDRFEIGPATDDVPADAILTVAPLTYGLLFLGRLSWQEEQVAGRVTVSGRSELAAGLPTWFGFT